LNRQSTVFVPLPDCVSVPGLYSIPSCCLSLFGFKAFREPVPVLAGSRNQCT
jgi:hypothetical protein